MSRRKQSNPKPLNKGDCAETTDEMTADSRDSKDLSPSELSDDADHSNEPQANRNHEADVDMSDERRMTDQPTLAHTNMNSPHDRLTIEDETNRPPSSASAVNAPHSPESSQNTSEPVERKFRIDTSADEAECGNEQSNGKTDAAIEAVRRPASASSATPSPPIREPTLEAAASASPTAHMLPKLRLNALLASDPALMPDAKDLKAMHEESQSKQRIAAAQLPPPPPLTKQQDDLEALLHAQAGNLVKEPPTAAAVAPAAAAEATAPRMKVFMCLPCGIGFSSPSTLEAHQAYYCSHRNKDVDDDAGGSLAAAITDKTSSLSAASTAASGGGALGGSSASGEPANKALKTGKQYACTQCSYSADKKVSLNRHMRMHQTSPALSSNASNGASVDENSSQQVDRYCSDCDIRFNNIKTYRAHKLHYCSSRRTDGQLTPKLEVSTAGAAKTSSVGAAISPQARTKTPTPAMVAAAAAAAAAAAMQAQPQAFLALPTNPILIIPYALMRAASLIPGPLTTASSGIPNPESTCFTLDNGSLKPLAAALNMNAINANANAAAAAASTAIASNTQMPAVDATRQPSMGSGSESLLTEKNAGRNAESAGTEGATKRKEGARESAPLDLSLRRSPIVASLQRHRLYSASSFLDAEQQRLEMETLLEAGKENLSLDESGSITPEQIVCAPSLPNSPSMSPSPKRRAISPRSSGAGSTSSMSPPAPNVSAASLAAAASASNMLDLPLRSMLPTDLALKLSESNIMNPLLAKQNLELALKLSAAAAVAANTSSVGVGGGSMPAELAAAAVAAAAGKSSLLGLPVLPSAAAAPSAGAGGGAVQPQIYVKQGVSKCKECNIVFCKYENYLAHKQHYCSARNQEPSEADAAKVSSTPPMAVGANTAETTPVAYQQLICAACGIKYTSLDNLRAHQNYYCPKGGGAAGVATAAAIAAESGQLPLPKEKCNKCKTMHEMGLPCPPPPALQQSQAAQHIPSASGVNVPTPGANSQNIYKCPVCDAVSLTASESRKHMETHGTVKAFRCSICRYKGNTLRGMRTHIRMHFDKKMSDLNEEHYMSCILEEDGLEIPSAATLSQEQLAHQIAAVKQQQQQHHQQQQLQQAAAAAAAAAVGLQQQQQQQQIYNCDLCNYTSSYKGNVLRHMKLVHPHISINSPSISPEAGDLDVAADGASLSSSLNGDNGFTIKTEPLDHPTALSNYTAAQSLSLAKLHDNNNSSIRPPSLPAPPPSAATIITATNNNASNEQMPHIKTEPMDIGTEPAPLPPSLGSPAIGPPPPSLNATPEENAAAAAAMNQKYCQTCDISFNYMKTYLAHKQFYCKNKIRRPDANDSPSPNAGMLLLQKNKENLQQEAAI